MLRLTALNVYPVKSCRGCTVTSSDVDSRGLVCDRRFLIVDAESRFLTQRVHPRMALIETALTGSELVLSSPGYGSVDIPLQPNTPNSKPKAVTIWKDTVTADDCGDESAHWLSGFLGFHCRLVRAGAAYTRPIPDRKLPFGLRIVRHSLGKGGDSGGGGSTTDPRPLPSHEVSFADAYPFLVISEESLAELNSRLDVPLPMNRFRPNLVVAGGKPYAEDEWARFRIGTVVFHGATHCIRCVVTTTDQSTAERGTEPLRTLATYRRVPEEGVKFGRNLIHETKTGRLAVGDAVELL